MKSGFLLNIVVTQSSSVFKLLASKDQPLLVRWNTFHVLDLLLDILNGVSWIDFKSDSLSS